MPRVAIASILSLAVSIAVAAPALAETPPRRKTVVLFVDQRVFPLARRLEQEIESLGMHVEVATEAPVDSGSSAATVLPNDAIATIRLSPLGGDDVDMSIADGAGKFVRYQLIASNPGEGPASELIATRAVELLRATLNEIASAPERQAPLTAPHPTPPVESPVRAEHQARGTVFLSLGPAALFAPHFGFGASAQGALTWLPAASFGLSASALIPVAQPRLEGRQGSVAVAASLFRVAGVLAVGGDDSLVGVRGSAGLELDVLRFEGEAVAPFGSAVDRRVSWSTFIGVAPRLRIAEHWHLVADLSIALASSSSRVRFAGQEQAEFGRPLATASLALELTWPRGRQ